VLSFTVPSTLWSRETLCHLYGVYKAILYLFSCAGDVLSFTVPSTLWSRETPCHLYGVYNACSANPKCGWCGSSGTCHRNIETFNCKGQ
jgi:hypothetical protein